MSSDSDPVLGCVKLTEITLSPTKESPVVAGLDLRSANDVVITAGWKELIKTDLEMKPPTGCYGGIAPRSALALQHHINVGAGVVDEDYRGNLSKIL
jgi:dUTP pyrophosphatase